MKSISIRHIRANPLSTVSDSFQTELTQKSEKLWIGLHFPRIALESIGPLRAGKPVFIVEEKNGRQVVYTACDLAIRQGVMSGMPINAAYALCHQPVIYLRQPEKEFRLLKQQSKLVSRYTPNISLHPPDSLVMEISGSLKLFNGMDNLEQSIRSLFPNNVVMSLTPSPSASLLFARHGIEKNLFHSSQLKSALSPISIRHLNLDTKKQFHLSKCGINNLRELWRLPRQDLGRRFGLGLIHLLDRLCAIEPDPQTPYSPPPYFLQKLTLPEETDNQKTVLIAAEKLLEELKSFLTFHAAAVERVIFSLHHPVRNHQPVSRTPFVVRTQEANRDPLIFFSLFKERLNRAILCQRVVAVTLFANKPTPYSGFNEDIFSLREGDTQEWHHMMEVIGTRLGEDNVYKVRSLQDHRPEKSWEEYPLNRLSNSCHQKSTPGENVGSDETFLSSSINLSQQQNRPYWLLEEPIRLVQGISSLRLTSNVERIEAGWWDDQDIRRDYYIATTKFKEQYWIYRDLSETKNNTKWFLHGIFG